MKGGRFAIGEGSIGDSRDIGELSVLVWRQAYRGILPDDVLASLDSGARESRVAASFGTGSVWRTARDSQHNLIGFVQGRRAQKHADWEMNAIYVHPEWQRAGVGRALQLALVEAISRQGAKSMSVYVLTRNYVAKRFYAKHGARLVGGDKLEVREVDYLLDVYVYDSLAKLKRSLQAEV